MAEERNWGYSVLFVDVDDVAPRNLALPCFDIPTFNILPVYGLNCLSMMKHDTLVLTVDAVMEIEKKLLQQMHRAQHKPYKYKDYKDTILKESAFDYDHPKAIPPFVV